MKQVALVTGSSRGIGLAAAEALAREGFSIAINGPTEDDELRGALARVEAIGVPCVSVPFDVSDLSAHAAALDRIETAIGPLTTLVNNAGVGVMHRGDMLDVTEESYDRCMSINAKAMFFLSQSFAKRLVASTRSTSLFYSIVNVTSSNAVAVAAPRSEYCVSKAAALMVTKTLAIRLGAENIAVYEVQPGVIATDMTAPVMAQYQEQVNAGLTLLPRIGQPEEMGTIIASLASGRLPYTTGQSISADAGMLVPRF
ncbi:MAG: 3-ketoacyl-ACP reductase [Pseudomonadota bacterium]